ncbi:MAG: hypothetical protein H2055_07730 [Sphingopyxis sp.]|nr:hypothetical protein [Sphingopyxis sp.]
MTTGISYRAGLTALAMIALPQLGEACEATIATSTPAVQIRPSPSFSDASSRERFSVTVRNGDDQTCDLALEISADPAFASSTFPAYRIAGPGGAIELGAQMPSAVGSGNLSFPVQIGSEAEQRLNYDVSVKLDWDLAAAPYEQRINFRLVDRTTSRVLDETQISLIVIVPLSSRLDFVGNSNRLDLGVIALDRPTTAPPFGVRVYSTSGYNLQFASENSGALISREGTGRLPYRMTVEGRELDLSAGSDRLLSADKSGATGDIYGVGVTVLPDANQRAGSYSDRVTVTVTPF